MLLARVAAEIRTDDELSARLLPVRFMEESQEISGIADFLARDAVPSRQTEQGS